MLVALLRTGSLSIADLAVVLGVVVAGVFAWRSRRGDFYKAVAEEKTRENETLKRDNQRLHQLTDITPIIDTLDRVTKALERSSDVTQQSVAKLVEMNGSVKANTVALEALASRLVVEEAALGLLRTAGEHPGRRKP